MDATAIPASRLYDGTAGNWEVASFRGADVTAGQAGYYGFEAYESGAAWSLSLQQGGIQAGNAFTGSRCYSGQSLKAAALSFVPRTGARYVVAAYVKLDPGAVCTLGFRDGEDEGLGVGEEWTVEGFAEGAPARPSLPLLANPCFSTSAPT